MLALIRQPDRRGEADMPTVKVLELVGVSNKSWDDAVQNALKEASKTVRGISGVDILHKTAKVKDGKIFEYHTDCKFAFRVE